MEDRTLYELLIVLKDNIINYKNRILYDSYGICCINTIIHDNSVILNSEYTILCEYLRNNLPYCKYGWSQYSFEIGDFDSRLKWIEEQIELTKPKNNKDED